MAKLCKNSGFSLTEVLLAVGIIAVGMTFVAGVFPVGIYLTTVATERTVAAIVADEAFSKIKIYGKDHPDGGVNFGPGGVEPDHLNDFSNVLEPGVEIDPNEFSYPSDPCTDNSQKQYFWSALCRQAGSDPNRLVQVTVFISRKISPNLRYFNHDFTREVNCPVPVKIGVVSVPGPGHEDELRIEEFSEKTFINDGYTIVDDATGRIYRVLERYRSPDSVILLDRNLDSPAPNEVWVVPPPMAPGYNVTEKRCSGRYPCIAVYQKVIRF